MNPFKTNEISLKAKTVKSGWSIVYIERLQFKISKEYTNFFSEDRFFLVTA